MLDPRDRRGGISDSQMRRRGRVRGCETILYAPPAGGRPRSRHHLARPARRRDEAGTSRDDTLLGSTGADIIRGLGGRDVIWGNQLHRDASRALDRLFGGAGADTIYGSPGRNTIRGEDGDDFLQGGSGRNAIYGGNGDDEIRLRGSGPNSVDAGPGNDVVHAYARARRRSTAAPASTPPTSTATTAPTAASASSAAERRPVAPAVRRSGSGARAVGPEDVLHRGADLAHRAAVLQRLADRVHEVVGAARGVAQLVEALRDELVVAVGLERRQAVELRLLGRGVDAQDVLDLDRRPPRTC